MDRVVTVFWWTVSILLLAGLIGSGVMLLSNAPDWSVYRSGGYNPTVKGPI